MDNLDFILVEMEEYEADGVDFVPVFSQLDDPNLTIIKSYTKEQWLNSNRAYPKSGRAYWRMVNGKKVYVEK